jgi:hypothetical protein
MAGKDRRRAGLRRVWFRQPVVAADATTAATFEPGVGTTSECGLRVTVAAPGGGVGTVGSAPCGGYRQGRASDTKGGHGDPPPLASRRAPLAAFGVSWYEVVGVAALGRIGYPWRDRLPAWSVRFLPGRPGLLGGTWTYEQRIEVYVREGQSVDDVAFTLAHELGHAVDVAVMTEADRQRWMRERAIADTVPWWVESGATDFSSGSGDWAEAFAVWQVGGQSHSRVAPAPSPVDLALVAELSRSR